MPATQSPGVVVDAKYPISGATLPGSTYAGNALASAAVAATLAQMKTVNLEARVARIHQTIETEMTPLEHWITWFVGARLCEKPS